MIPAIVMATSDERRSDRGISAYRARSKHIARQTTTDTKGSKEKSTRFEFWKLTFTAYMKYNWKSVNDVKAQMDLGVLLRDDIANSKTRHVPLRNGNTGA
jgi:hypothetical protein